MGEQNFLLATGAETGRDDFPYSGLEEPPRCYGDEVDAGALLIAVQPQCLWNFGADLVAAGSDSRP